MSTGGSYGSNALEVHIGIGKADTIEKIVVWWQKSDDKQLFTSVDINQKIRIIEKKVEYEIANEPSFVIDPSQLGQKHEHSGDVSEVKSCH